MFDTPCVHSCGKDWKCWKATWQTVQWFPCNSSEGIEKDLFETLVPSCFFQAIFFFVFFFLCWRERKLQIWELSFLKMQLYNLQEYFWICLRKVPTCTFVSYWPFRKYTITGYFRKYTLTGYFRKYTLTGYFRKIHTLPQTFRKTTVYSFKKVTIFVVSFGFSKRSLYLLSFSKRSLYLLSFSKRSLYLLSFSKRSLYLLQTFLALRTKCGVWKQPTCKQNFQSNAIKNCILRILLNSNESAEKTDLNLAFMTVALLAAVRRQHLISKLHRCCSFPQSVSVTDQKVQAISLSSSKQELSLFSRKDVENTTPDKQISRRPCFFLFFSVSLPVVFFYLVWEVSPTEVFSTVVLFKVVFACLKHH